MKIGRNMPCPCGSGKKYKKCCMKNTNVVPATDLAYRRISKDYRDLELKLETYMSRHFDAEDLEDALSEFFCELDEEDDYLTEDVMDGLQDLYRPWILYNWDCGLDLDDAGSEDEMGMTIAEAYMKENIKKITEPEKNLITAISRKPYCFWEVTDVEPGECIEIKNIITGKSIRVTEHMGSKSVKSKNIVFARVVTVENVNMFVGMGRTVIPYRIKPNLIQLRQDIKDGRLVITDEDLWDWDMDLRQAYFDIDRHLHTPPKLQNTDGDPLELHKLIFEITNPESVFKKLVSLCTIEPADTIRRTAEKDKTGCIKKVNFSWTKKGNKKISHFDNTILGEISISPEQLTIQVNSANRAKRICKEIKTRLGSEAKFKIDAVEDMNAIMAHPDEDSLTHKKVKAEQDALMTNPEIQQKLKEIVSKHWDDWVDMKIPALGNMTPRKAVKTSDGKEAVEALLYDAEISKKPDPFLNELDRQGVQKVRKKLGLD